MTVHNVLQILRLHISVPQCDVFGYLSIDHELVVLFAPVDQHPTPMQVTHTHTELCPLNIKNLCGCFPKFAEGVFVLLCFLPDGSGEQEFFHARHSAYLLLVNMNIHATTR